MNKQINLILVLCLCSLFRVYGQQDLQISQYMNNGNFLNPAYAGTHNYNTASLLIRKQWFNLNGSPFTAFASVDGPIKDKRMGVGAVFYNDQVGVINETKLFGNYSYKVPLGQGENILALGLRAGITYHHADVTALETTDPNDPLYQSNVNRWLPNFGTGVYFYNPDSYYAGFSVPTLLAYDSREDISADQESFPNLVRHYFLTAGSVHRLNDEITLLPSFLMKATDDAPIQFDLTMKALVIDQLWAGVTYRTNASIAVMLGFQATESFRFGYAFDFATTKLARYQNGTHELMVSYDFGSDDKAMRRPRMF